MTRCEVDAKLVPGANETLHRGVFRLKLNVHAGGTYNRHAMNSDHANFAQNDQAIVSDKRQIVDYCQVFSYGWYSRPYVAAPVASDEGWHGA